MATKKKPAPATLKEGAEKVFVAGLARDETRYLYYVDKQCNIVRMERGVPKAKTEVVVVSGLKREKGYGYFVDADGDLSREPE
ncbi:MAG: hypothetical protein Q8O67_26305 [Deltaproteobacteria bacterium]|nr:hypothetical protein [Deltaproteobacteria bacterium]